MEWSNDDCLALIDQYEENSILWDPKHPFYFSKSKKCDAWDTISRNLNMDTEIVKKKMSSLLGSFRAQRSKSRRFIGTGKGTSEIYVSKWFAFDRMKFLLDKDEQKGSTDTETQYSILVVSFIRDTKVYKSNILDSKGPVTLSSIFEDISYFVKIETDKMQTEGVIGINWNDSASEDENLTQYNVYPTQSNMIKIEPHIEQTDDPSNGSNQNLNTAENHVLQQKRPRLPKPKRRMSEEDAKRKEAYKLRRDEHARCMSLSMSKQQDNFQDRFDIYGQHIASKLRTYSARTEAMVEHAINNILFEADMGNFDKGASSVAVQQQHNLLPVTTCLASPTLSHYSSSSDPSNLPAESLQTEGVIGINWNDSASEDENLTQYNVYPTQSNMIKIEPHIEQTDDPLNGSNQNLNTAENHVLQQKRPRLPKPKRRMSEEDAKRKEACKLRRDELARCMSLSMSKQQDNFQDRFDIYGQHIASKLRTYSARTEAMVEHAVNNVLFEADMGNFDGGASYVAVQQQQHNPLPVTTCLASPTLSHYSSSSDPSNLPAESLQVTLDDKCA